MSTWPPLLPPTLAPPSTPLALARTLALPPTPLALALLPPTLAPPSTPLALALLPLTLALPPTPLALALLPPTLALPPTPRRRTGQRDSADGTQKPSSGCWRRYANFFTRELTAPQHLRRHSFPRWIR
jgi:hypothetical protein